MSGWKAAWRAATPEEVSDYLAGEVVMNATGGYLDTRETVEGFEVWDGEQLDCGHIPHNTRMRGMWGFYCDTEEQPYCNFECECDDDTDAH